MIDVILCTIKAKDLPPLNMEAAVSIIGALFTIVVFLGGIVVRSLYKTIQQNSEMVKTVDQSSSARVESLKQTHNEDMRLHEEADRKRASKIYDRLEKDFVKKESLGYMLQNMSTNIDDIKVLITDHVTQDRIRTEEASRERKELSDRTIKIETQLGV